MTFSAGLFVPGLLLTIFPADRLLSSWAQLRSFDSLQTLENSTGDRRWWGEPILWLDPLRAFAGAWLLQESLGLRFLRWTAMSKPAFAVFATVLALGLLCQLFTRRERESLLAPVGFVVGVTATFTTWTVIAVGAAIGLTAMFALRQLQAFFICGAAALGLFGAAMKAPGAALGLALGLFLVPFLTAFLTGRILEIPTRSPNRPGAAP